MHAEIATCSEVSNTHSGSCAGVLSPSAARAEATSAPGWPRTPAPGSRQQQPRAKLRQRPRWHRHSGGAMGKGHHRRRARLRLEPQLPARTNDFGSNSVIDVMGNIIVRIPIGGTHGAGRSGRTPRQGLGLCGCGQIDGGTVATVSSSNQRPGLERGRRRDGVFLGSLRPAAAIAVSAEHQNTSTANNSCFDPGNFHFWRASIGVVIFGKSTVGAGGQGQPAAGTMRWHQHLAPTPAPSHPAPSTRHWRALLTRLLQPPHLPPRLPASSVVNATTPFIGNSTPASPPTTSNRAAAADG
mgnify:CR=1 FL=1